MTIFQAGLLGVIEGITEFLPISSTGHLVLAARLMDLPANDFLKTFQISIQSAAILAVVVLYWHVLLTSSRLIKNLIFAFVPTALIGFFVYPFVRSFLENEALTAFALILGGVIIILFERMSSIKVENKVSPQKAFIIGVIQTLAFVPGVSRAAATILGGLSLGVSRKEIVEFSFLLAIPTMAAATLYDLYKNFETVSFGGSNLVLLSVGAVTAFISSLIVIRWFLRYAQTHTFTSFGVYRIVVGIIFLLLWS